MRIFVLILLIILLGSIDKPKIPFIVDDFSLKDEMNQSIIDGFFDGDTTGKNVSQFHFIK